MSVVVVANVAVAVGAAAIVVAVVVCNQLAAGGDIAAVFNVRRKWLTKWSWSTFVRAFDSFEHTHTIDKSQFVCSPKPTKKKQKFPMVCMQTQIV